ncbi:MAG: hypothetical protein ACXW04_12960, partial [Methylobacter sp.]
QVSYPLLGSERVTRTAGAAAGMSGRVIFAACWAGMLIKAFAKIATPRECDYKAAAVYTRSAFEKILRKYCQDKKKKITFKAKLKDYTTEDFWDVVKSDVNSSLQSEIKKYRALVLNPFSHYNTEKHEIKTELKNTINAVIRLKKELPV